MSAKAWIRESWLNGARWLPCGPIRGNGDQSRTSGSCRRRLSVARRDPTCPIRSYWVLRALCACWRWMDTRGTYVFLLQGLTPGQVSLQSSQARHYILQAVVLKVTPKGVLLTDPFLMSVLNVREIVDVFPGRLGLNRFGCSCCKVADCVVTCALPGWRPAQPSFRRA